MNEDLYYFLILVEKYRVHVPKSDLLHFFLIERSASATFNMSRTELFFVVFL